MRAAKQDHPDVALALTSLGNVQRELGNLEEALRAHERALHIDERVFGPEAANELDNIGGILRKQRKYEQALLVYQPAFRIRAQALGPDHPELGEWQANIDEVERAIASTRTTRELTIDSELGHGRTARAR